MVTKVINFVPNLYYYFKEDISTVFRADSVEPWSHKAVYWIFNSSFLYPTNHPDPIKVSSIQDLTKALESIPNVFASRTHYHQTYSHIATKPIRFLLRTLYLLTILPLVSFAGALKHAKCKNHHFAKIDAAIATISSICCLFTAYFLRTCRYIDRSKLRTFLFQSLPSLPRALIQGRFRELKIPLFFITAAFSGYYFFKELLEKALELTSSSSNDLTAKQLSIIAKNYLGIMGTSGECVNIHRDDLVAAKAAVLLEYCRLVVRFSILQGEKTDTYLYNPWRAINNIEDANMPGTELLIAKLKNLQESYYLFNGLGQSIKLVPNSIPWLKSGDQETHISYKFQKVPFPKKVFEESLNDFNKNMSINTSPEAFEKKIQKDPNINIDYSKITRSVPDFIYFYGLLPQSLQETLRSKVITFSTDFHEIPQLKKILPEVKIGICLEQDHQEKDIEEVLKYAFYVTSVDIHPTPFERFKDKIIRFISTTSIQHLYLDRLRHIEDKDFKEILSHAKELTILYLPVDEDDKGIVTIHEISDASIEAISKLSSLKAISMTYRDVSKKQLEKLLPLPLEVLDLEGSTESTIKAFTELERKFKHLTTLSFSNSQIEEEQLKKVKSKYPLLKTLSLSNCQYISKKQ